MYIRITLAAATVLMLTSCAGSNSAEDIASPVSSRPTAHDKASDAAALEKAVRDYTAAVYSSDPDTAFGLSSERCRTRTSKARYDVLIELMAEDAGHRTVQSFTLEKMSGDAAHVSYSIGLPNLDPTNEPWTREGGKWLFDGCTSVPAS
ncbi:hypothetical protein ACQEVG_18075 [Streptomyces sp. CA-135486]|uniref:hypothetical protein n=1 Tax=Streptomyces sp. CA-135486 TaxID=3240049 RepID=UPI003D8B3DB0